MTCNIFLIYIVLKANQILLNLDKYQLRYIHINIIPLKFFLAFFSPSAKFLWKRLPAQHKVSFRPIASYHCAYTVLHLHLALLCRTTQWPLSGAKWVVCSGSTSASCDLHSTLWTRSARVRLLELPQPPLRRNACPLRAASSSRTRTWTSSRPRICSALILRRTGHPHWPTCFSHSAVCSFAHFALHLHSDSELLHLIQPARSSGSTVGFHSKLCSRPTADGARALRGWGLQLDRRQRHGDTRGRDEWTGAFAYVLFIWQWQ